MKLILHFDINKTIIIADKAANKDEYDVINEILCQHTFGSVQEFEEDGQKKYKWIPESKTPSIEKEKEGTISYSEFLDEYALPYPKDPTLSPREKLKIHSEINRKSGLEKVYFTEKGKPGNQYRPYFEEMVKKVALEDGKFEYLLPCFLELILYLEKSKFDYEIVFRTFGSDFQEFKLAFNDFCNGKDPKYKNIFFNGENGTTDLRIHEVDTLYRNGDSIEDCYLILKTEKKIEKVDKSFKKKDIQDFYPNEKVLQGHEIYEYIINGKGSLFIQDYYFWWNINIRAPKSGKLFIIDNSSEILQIFFDDNVLIHNSMDNGIIDQRDFHSGEYIPTGKTLGMNLHQVYPLLSIQNEGYFIDLLQKSLEKWKK